MFCSTMFINKGRQTIYGLNKFALRMSSGSNKKKSSSSTYFDLNSYLKSVNVTYNIGNNLNQSVTVKANYVDICPSESPRATVIGVPGSPGTHNDYKYMKDELERNNIRMIFLNWPGSEYVTGAITHTFNNVERNAFAKAVLEKLDIKNSNRLIIAGHSRGGENALMLSNILSKEDWPVIGTTLINSPGFHLHKGVRSRYTTVQSLVRIILLDNPIINYFMFPVLNYFYNNIVGLRVANGKIAAAAMLPLTTFALHLQRDPLKELKDAGKVQIFYGYGAKDFLIEEHISEEFARFITPNQHYIIRNKSQSEEAIKKAKEDYLSRKLYVTANFTEEGHYLQKSYPEFITSVIDAMVQSNESTS